MCIIINSIFKVFLINQWNTHKEKKHLNYLAFKFPTGIKNSSSAVLYCFSFYVAHECPSLSSITCACLYCLQVYSDSYRLEMLFSGPKHRKMAASYEEKMMHRPTSLRPWVTLLLALSSESINLWYIQNELPLNRNTYKNKGMRLSFGKYVVMRSLLDSHPVLSLGAGVSCDFFHRAKEHKD